MIAIILAVLGGYQLARLFVEVGESSAQRSVQLLEIEESLDDAAIGLGSQVQEWKNMLLRIDDKALYVKHQQGFKDASIAVQYALIRGRETMLGIGMETAEMDQLIMEHKALLTEYLHAYNKIKPGSSRTSSEVDMQVLGVDRKLQARIFSVKTAVSTYAKQQLHRAPHTQGNRSMMIGLLGAISLLIMALFGFAFACRTGGP
ncbi:MAG: hypothetical protein WC298_07945 [Sideroxydans sp.]